MLQMSRTAWSRAEFGDWKTRVYGFDSVVLDDPIIGLFPAWYA